MIRLVPWYHIFENRIVVGGVVRTIVALLVVIKHYYYLRMTRSFPD